MGSIWFRVCLTVLLYIVTIYFADGYKGMKMGIRDSDCDDGKTNITTDWDNSTTAYSCMEPRKWSSSPTVQSFYYTIPNFVPKYDEVYHICIDTPIFYNDTPPIRGDHRPLWAKWGEYLYLPPQRWLHNLEHGGVVMLYHPCTEEHEVTKLREIMKTCLYRHIITSYNKLSPERPLALVSWGSKLEMNVVNTEQVITFIKNHTHNAPEDLSDDGQYEETLIRPSTVVSDLEDKVVCPWAPDIISNLIDIYFESSNHSLDNNSFIR